MYEMTYVELPPRARRIRCASIKLPSCPGTTSACAENTQTPLLKQHRTRNYLRVRGEYSPARWWSGSLAELPPRARRIHRGKSLSVRMGRTTSACAENTGNPDGKKTLMRNYLRVRGEYHTAHWVPLDQLELPPRARRIPFREGVGDIDRGTTSACAENTPCLS